MKSARLLLTIAVSAVTAPMLAADPDVIDKELDLGGAGRRHFIAFCAHGEGVGHAFVSIGTHDEVNQVCSARSIGFYPERGSKNAILSVFTKVDSRLEDEIRRGKLTDSACRLVVDLSPDKYTVVQEIVDDWVEKSRDFQLGVSDCVTFTETIARELDLKTPTRKRIAIGKEDAAFPTTFMRLLAEMNGEDR